MPEKNMVREIFMAFGSLRIAAKKMNVPFPTVYSWVKTSNIPHWRRAAVLREVGRRHVKISPEQRAYLLSKDGVASVSTATIEQEAHA